MNIGGPSIQAINLSRELTAEGFETCLIHGHLAEGEGDMTHLLPLSATGSLYIDELVRPIAPLRDLRALWSIYKALRRWKPDIVHTHMAKAGTLGRVASIAYNCTRRRSRRARLIHTYHGHVFEGYFNAVSTRLFLIIERWLAKRTDVLIAISPNVANDVLHTYQIGDARQVRLIPLGFNLDRLLAVSPSDRVDARKELAIPDAALVVTTIGRLTAIKHQTLFLQMAQCLIQSSHRFVFLVVGDGDLRADLQMQAKQLGVEEQMRFLGWRGDLETIYGATDLFVLTSRNEGTPVALIEAMAAGVPSVSTDVGGVRDVITGPDLGLLVPFGDPHALAAAVMELADDPHRRQKLGLQARASMQERFQGGCLVGSITQLYRQLLNERNVP